MIMHVFVWIVAVFMVLLAKRPKLFGMFTFTVAIIIGTLISWGVSLIISDIAGLIVAVVAAAFAPKELTYD